MKLCIPTRTDGGNGALVHDHFGSAPFFTIYDTQAGSIAVVRNDNQRHVHGACQPMNVLQGQDIHAVVCRGMGARALQRLNDAGIKVFLSHDVTIADVIGSYAEEKLQELTIEDCCRNHSCKE